MDDADAEGEEATAAEGEENSSNSSDEVSGPVEVDPPGCPALENGDRLLELTSTPEDDDCMAQEALEPTGTLENTDGLVVEEALRGITYADEDWQWSYDNPRGVPQSLRQRSRTSPMRTPTPPKTHASARN